MMNWLEGDVDLDAASAAAIAKGMRAVAQADGSIHQRELSLIATFEAEIPSNGEPADSFASDAAKQAYLRSIIMVALADGVITDKEEQVIGELCDAYGIGRAQIHAETLEVKRWFLQAFSGVHIFRDAVVRVAKDLGLPDNEVEALRGEA
jgi:uncharacterized membrane protein YebE (DUF533 family)